MSVEALPSVYKWHRYILFYTLHVFLKIFLLHCFLLSSSPLFVPNRATTGVHAPAACLRQHDHVGAQRLVQRHDVWGGGAGWNGHTAQQTGGKTKLIHTCTETCYRGALFSENSVMGTLFHPPKVPCEGSRKPKMARVHMTFLSCRNVSECLNWVEALVRWRKKDCDWY